MITQMLIHNFLQLIQYIFFDLLNFQCLNNTDKNLLSFLDKKLNLQHFLIFTILFVKYWLLHHINFLINLKFFLKIHLLFFLNCFSLSIMYFIISRSMLLIRPDNFQPLFYKYYKKHFFHLYLNDFLFFQEIF